MTMTVDTSLFGEVKGRSLWVDARRRLLKNRAAMASIIRFSLSVS